MLCVPNKEGAAMVRCKHCRVRALVKHGWTRGKQRYYGKACRRHYVEGDARGTAHLGAQQALAVVLYSVGKASFGLLAQVCGVSRALTSRWIKAEAAGRPEPAIAGDIREIALDEMWHFLQKKLKNSGSSRPWIVAQGRLLPGLQVAVMLQPSGASTPKSRT